MESTEYEGPKEPRDDDDDDDDAAAFCGCDECCPAPIPTGPGAITALAEYIRCANQNLDGATEFAVAMTKELTKSPQCAEIETIMLQFCCDMWNSADRTRVALAKLIPAVDPDFDVSQLAEVEPKTLDDARRILERRRANRPRKRDHNLLTRVEQALKDKGFPNAKAFYVK